MTDNNKLSSHILPTSATMVGVCATLIGLIKLWEIGRVNTRVDELMAIDAILFLISAALSYMAIRATTLRRNWFERVADLIFMCGLALMTFGATLLAFSIS